MSAMLVFLVAGVALALIAACRFAPDASGGGDDEAVEAIRADIASKGLKKEGRWRRQVPAPDWDVSFPEGATYAWELDTNLGTVRIDLLPDVAPKHVLSTIYLTELGFYDGLGFHRVIPGFMAQGGCPDGDGRGSPAYRYEGEFAPTARHEGRGVLSMANAGPGTDGSQFFITLTSTPHLDGNHTVFGRVVSGDETLERMEALGSSPGGATREPITIEKARIVVG